MWGSEGYCPMVFGFSNFEMSSVADALTMYLSCSLIFCLEGNCVFAAFTDRCVVFMSHYFVGQYTWYPFDQTLGSVQAKRKNGSG